MVEHLYFSHAGRDGSQPAERIRASGYLSSGGSWRIGENLAWGTGELAPPKAIMAAWMNSAGHRANILQPAYREIGFGVLAGNPSSREQRRRHLRHRVRLHRPPPTRTSSGRSRSTPLRRAAAKARERRASRRARTRSRRARARRARARRPAPPAPAPRSPRAPRRGRIVGSVAVVRGSHPLERFPRRASRRTLGLEPAVSRKGVPHGVLRPARPRARGRQPHRGHPRPARLRARARPARTVQLHAARPQHLERPRGASPTPRTTPTRRPRRRSSSRCRCSRRPPARR